MTTRLAEEKESKAREGMKIMGLNDSTYYISWFIFNLIIVTYISFWIVSILQLETFWLSNAWLIFFICVLYGTQFYGFSFTIVGILPTKKASATAASLLHIATFYILYLYKGYGTSMLEKTLVSCFVPNVALGFMLDHLLHVEVEGGVGLTFETAWLPYQSYNVIIGLCCQLFCVVLWSFLGIYFDKIMPREFGRNEPWNFICKKSKKLNSFVDVGEEFHD